MRNATSFSVEQSIASINLRRMAAKTSIWPPWKRSAPTRKNSAPRPKKFAKKHGEHATVVNAIESHHGDVPATSVISILVAAADTLSAARPGSRSETIENYIQRLEKLEEMAKSFDGVDRVFAIQAGREVRIVVKPDKVDDLMSHKIARDIKTKIEEELTYPGHIKVTVIREVRASEVAK